MTLVGVAQYLVDEPNADEYAGLATTVAKVRSQDPHALSFINLLPSNVSGYGMNKNLSKKVRIWRRARCTRVHLEVPEWQFQLPKWQS